MKICYLSDANSAHTKKWCKYFSEKGHEVEVISLNDGTIEGVKVYSLGINTSKIRNKFVFQKIIYLKDIFKVKKMVHDIKPDILHAHYCSSYGILGSLCNYKPYILSVWGSDIYDFPSKGILFKKLIEYNLSKADKILSTSKAMAKETSKYTSKEIAITPFGVDTKKFIMVNNIAKDPNYIVIGIIKSLEKNYGIEYLIKAISLLVEKKYSIKLKIFGKGSEEDYLKRLVSQLNLDNVVSFGGYIKEDHVVSELNSFHIAVFPSVQESFGVAAVEAQACGVPVVVSDTPGLMEATSPNRTSLVAQKENYIDLAEKIEILIKDEKLRKDFSKNCREFVREKYDLSDNFKKVEEIYLEIINSEC